MRGKTITLALLVLSGTGCDPKKSSKHPEPTTPSGPQLTNSLGLKANVWATRVYRGAQPSCSVYYDFSRSGAYDYHVVCIAKDRRTIQLESYEYSLSVQDRLFSAALIKSSCPNATKSYQFTVTPSDKQLTIASNGEYVYLQIQDNDILEENLRTATTLHGKPIVRGCFSTNLQTFTPAEGSI